MISESPTPLAPTPLAEAFPGEEFVPNCTVRVTGKHFFTDRAFYTNPYGLSFFDSPEQYSDNPYVASAYADSPGLTEEMIGDIVPPQKVNLPPCEAESHIMRQIDPRFVVRAPSGNQNQKNIQSISCRFDGSISAQGESVILQYGAALPCVICATGDCVSANFPFSPFSELSFQKDRSVMQSLLYPMPSADFFAPPDEMVIDFLVTTKRFINTLRVGAPGILRLDYTLTVGTTRCETTKLLFEVEPMDRRDCERCSQ